MSEEKRRHTRFPIQFPVRIRSVNSKKEASGIVSTDLSLSGMGVMLTDPLDTPVGTEVDVTLSVNDDDETRVIIQMRARISWARPGQCGLEIISFVRDDRTLYEGILASLGHKP